MWERLSASKAGALVRVSLCRLFCWRWGWCGPRIVLVRHADYDVAPGVPGPGLNPAGIARREQLAHVLARFDISHIIVSEFARTQETAVTLAVDNTLIPEQLAAYDLDAIEASVRSHGSTVVIIGHSDTVPALISRFTSGSGPSINSRDFDDLFIVERGRLLHLQYGA